MNKKEDKEFSQSLTIPLPSNLVDLSLNTIRIELICAIDKLDLEVNISTMMKIIFVSEKKKRTLLQVWQ